MVLSKQTYTPVCFENGGVPLQAAKSINYLGFVISGNGKYRNLINDRVMKAKRVSNMVLQALRTNENVSVRFALSLFDKQITPILRYGCPIWSLPDSQNLIYLINWGGQHQRYCLQSYIWKAGQARYKSDTNRNILIRLKNYCDKDDLLSSAGNSPYVFENFTAEYKNEIEKVHTSFMKITLNVSKYSSNKCMYAKLARFPLSHNAWGLGIKYWLRLYNWTNNTLLNNFYRLYVQENHQWVQNIQYILTSNCFGDIWSNRQIVRGGFHKVLKMHLNDQFIQEWQGAISTSSRFVTRRALSIDYKLPVYINQIRNPDIQLIYTRLRADLNILSTSRAS